MNELVLFDKDLINQAIISKKEYNPQQKQQALQVYSQYLDTIFPDSKVKDIVYHGSDEVFDSFKTFKDSNVEGVFYTYSKDSAKIFGNILSIMVNSKTPLIEEDSILYDSISSEAQEKLSKNYDSVITPNEMGVVFTPKQIHILGNKQDIEGFKKFTQPSTSVKAKGEKVKEGIYVNQAALSKDEQPVILGDRQISVNQFNITVKPDGTMFYDNGKEVTDQTTKNKVNVRKELQDGTLRSSVYNNSNYFVLLDNRIVGSGKTNLGKESITDPKIKEAILAKAITYKKTC